ncbi:MAG: metal-dependent transcriptional regulator [Actinobacteria bacterium]|nr:metal-dependent transcriptional regulator [Actinomycetota bacterium]
MGERASRAVLAYLKALYLLAEESSGSGVGAPPGLAQRVSTSAIAARMGVSAPSATNMLKRLAARDLVTYEPYKGGSLTQKGREVALEIVRHHRLLETYLVGALGVPWDEAHAEAEALEGDLSETLEERISAALGDPQFDPHGHPIPAKNGAMPKTSRSRRSLWDVGDGEAALIEQVPDSHPDALRYLAEVGVLPRASVTVESRGPIGGPLFVRIKDDKETAPMALSKEIAEAIWVQ